MFGFFRRVLTPLRIVGAVAALAFVAPVSVKAAPLLPATPFSYDGSPNPVLAFTASGAGTLTFSLLLPAAFGQEVIGAFSATITSPGEDLNIDFFGLSYEAPERDFQLVSFGTTLSNDPLVLYGTMVWSTLATAGEYQINIISVLEPSFAGFAPTIAVDFEASVNPVPLPGALPLFATGLGIAAFAQWRRRRKQQNPAV